MKYCQVFFISISFLLQYVQLDNRESCVEALCDPGGGVCMNEICTCKKGHTTFLNNRDHRLCNYKQKHSVSAGLLELFFGSGMGHFYAGRSINGLLKLCLTIFFCFSCCCSFYLIRKLEEDPRSAGHPHISFLFIFAVTIGITLFFWQLVDSILFIFGIYYDGNNVSLY